MAEWKSTRRLSLPGGGTFDLEMPRDGGSFIALPPEMDDALDAAAGNMPTIVAGAVLGGVLTWLLLKLGK